MVMLWCGVGARDMVMVIMVIDSYPMACPFSVSVVVMIWCGGGSGSGRQRGALPCPSCPFGVSEDGGNGMMW